MEKICLLLDNVCSALDWAFSPSGNTQAGRELAALFGASLFVAASPMPLSVAKAEKPQATNHDRTAVDFESGRCHAGDSNDGNGSRWKDTARFFHKPRQ
ncbi:MULTISPECIES: hypothetical protein [unclassified Paraburkholderia]|uniref:hypothetical protein n=1 Tax=unclassified Paraburkholderia TaxID=2615204 RepID=UPI0038BABC9F